jgi:enamine deaminase RidA (YjgF/YER057c/UK114 family)
MPALAGLAAISTVLSAANFEVPRRQTMGTQSAKMHEEKAFRIFNPETMAKPTVGYSQVAEVGEGKIVYIAGQVALDKSGNLVGKDDFRAQVQQVFENVKAAVEASGGDFHNVIKLNYYCVASVDPAQMAVAREVRDKYVNTANPPTSTFVYVSRLVRPEWLIEVEAVAVVKK